MKIEAQALAIGDEIHFRGLPCRITELERTAVETRLLLTFVDYNGYTVYDQAVTLDNHHLCVLLSINSHQLDGGPTS